MINSIDAKKPMTKSNNLSGPKRKQNKPPNKLGIEEKFPQAEGALKNNNNNNKNTDKIIPNVEIVKAFPLRSGTKGSRSYLFYLT